MAGIDLIDLNKYYGAVHAVKDVRLSFGPEEFVVLVGPSGCGKTTVLRMVAGLETISSGELLIASQRANELSPAQRDIAMVFQNYALYPNMSVYENMAFGLRNRGASRDRVDSEIRRAADVLGIEKLLTRKPRQLSGGQQQRVALGRCLVRHPKVFLFDEPLSNLDAKLRLEMRQELKRLRSRISATSVYVTHDQVEAMTLGDRVVVMANGQVQQAGTPAEIYHRPQNVFVATFIGSPPMNLLPVRISNDGGVPVFEAQSLKVPVPADLAALLARHGSSSVLLGLRPEDVTVQPAPGPQSHATGVVELSELLGSEQLLETRVGDATVTATRIDPFAKFTPGDVVGLQFAPANIHVFDPATGTNLAADRKTASGTDVTSFKQPPRRSKAFSN